MCSFSTHCVTQPFQKAEKHESGKNITEHHHQPPFSNTELSKTLFFNYTSEWMKQWKDFSLLATCLAIVEDYSAHIPLYPQIYFGQTQ